MTESSNEIRCGICGSWNYVGDTHCAYCDEEIEPENTVYVAKNFSDAHMEIILHAREILKEYRDQGYRLTLRQLYYQYVAKGIIENTEQSYKRLGGIITDARLAGWISFMDIEDRGRRAQEFFVQPSVSGAFKDLPSNYAEDLWSDQPSYVEVWVEKDALSSVIQRPCSRFAVPYMACKGYMSSSAAWEAGQRFKTAINAGKIPLLLHLGDHDPSGIDMTRDNEERLFLFAGESIEVRRLALNMDQVRHYSPPPNPAKLSDSRAGDYVSRHGRKSWELDALKPAVIDRLISDEIRSVLDDLAWNDKLERQRQNRATLQEVADNADKVLKYVEGL